MQNGIQFIDEDGDEFWYTSSRCGIWQAPDIFDSEPGMLHRIDGPAVITHAQSGTSYRTYWLDGNRFNDLDHWLDALDVTDAEKVLLKMQWGNGRLLHQAG